MLNTKTLFVASVAAFAAVGSLAQSPLTQSVAKSAITSVTPVPEPANSNAASKPAKVKKSHPKKTSAKKPLDAASK